MRRSVASVQWGVERKAERLKTEKLKWDEMACGHFDPSASSGCVGMGR